MLIACCLLPPLPLPPRETRGGPPPALTYACQLQIRGPFPSLILILYGLVYPVINQNHLSFSRSILWPTLVNVRPLGLGTFEPPWTPNPDRYRGLSPQGQLVYLHTKVNPSADLLPMHDTNKLLSPRDTALHVCPSSHTRYGQYGILLCSFLMIRRTPPSPFPSPRVLSR